MSNFFSRFQFITLWIQRTQKKVYFALPKPIYLFYITTLTIYHISHFYILQFISFKIKYNDLFNPQTDLTRRERRERDKKVNKIYDLIFFMLPTLLSISIWYCSYINCFLQWCRIICIWSFGVFFATFCTTQWQCSYEIVLNKNSCDSRDSAIRPTSTFSLSICHLFY